MIKIFYSGVQYDHYDPKKGLSFEHNNFYLSLKKYPGAEVTYFPFDRIIEAGKEKFNEELLAAAKQERPDLFFFFMYSDELDKNILTELKKYTTTLAWFADDSWRFYNYSKFWACHFSWVVTTYSWMPELYRALGQKNVIRSQWAADPETYKPQKQKFIEKIPDVSFVGLWSKPRAEIMNYLAKCGIGVAVFGGGWPQGRRAKEEEMLELFSLSKINLGLNPPPGLWSKNSLGRLSFRMSVNKIVPDLHLFANIRSWLHMRTPQIKARHFQIPACGGFLLTSMADDLQSHYKLDEEMAVYSGKEDLAEKIKYYLAHDGERKKIAKVGYERTVRDHTYEKRFSKIFAALGLR